MNAQVESNPIGQKQQVVRGQNPEPSEGWPWNLTAFEVEYIIEFNVRPMRPSGWGDAAAEQRLDEEAEGVKEHRKVAALRRKTWPLAPVMIIFCGTLVASLALSGLAIFEHQESIKISDQVRDVGS